MTALARGRIDRARLAAALTRLRGPTNRPVLVALVACIAGTVFAGARLVIAAQGNISGFIVVGTSHASSDLLFKGIAIHPGSGYDGQFYYRMALDPLDFNRSAFGIRLDSLSRLERIGYSTIAWLLAAGRHDLIPYTLVITNIVALGALGYGAALLARDSGRHAMWGLAVAGFWGYLWTLGRDLTEITAAAFLLLGLYAYRRDRGVLAAVLLLGAVLSKETAALVVGVIAATRLVGWALRHDRRPVGSLDIAWFVPLTGFVGWEAIVFASTGTVPLLSSGKHNIGLPFVGTVAGLRDHVPGLPSVPSLLWAGEFAVLILVIVAAGASIRAATVPIHERLAWAAVLLVAVCAAPGVWRGDVGFRSLDDVYLFSWIVLFGTRRRLWPIAAMTAAAWLIVAVELIKYI